MDEFLSKPVSIPELVACLRRWMPHTTPLAGDMVASVPLPQAAGAPLPIDPATLDMLTGGDPAQTRALLDDFLETTFADLAEMDSARQAGDLAAVARQAHKIKGASRLVGAMPLGEAAAGVEAAAKASDWAELLPCCADLATAAERLRMHVAGHYMA
jgi:HPt (histidine-containing phosphotransfer) domain-containing protein